MGIGGGTPGDPEEGEVLPNIICYSFGQDCLEGGRRPSNAILEHIANIE